MRGFHSVDILVNATDPDRHYTDLTQDLEARLKAHNSGQLPYTAKFKPWRIDVAIAFQSKQKARAFEGYLKSHSGRAFASKHF